MNCFGWVCVWDIYTGEVCFLKLTSLSKYQYLYEDACVIRIFWDWHYYDILNLSYINHAFEKLDNTHLCSFWFIYKMILLYWLHILYNIKASVTLINHDLKGCRSIEYEYRVYWKKKWSFCKYQIHTSQRCRRSFVILFILRLPYLAIFRNSKLYLLSTSECLQGYCDHVENTFLSSPLFIDSIIICYQLLLSSFDWKKFHWGKASLKATSIRIIFAKFNYV